MWIEIEYSYDGIRSSTAELGYEAAIYRIESLTLAGAVITRVEQIGR